jgi:uncharacterized protein (DUF2147 family)
MRHITQHIQACVVKILQQTALATLFLSCVGLALAQNTSTPVGTWQTIDDHTGQPKALVQIIEDSNGELSGKVIKGLALNDNPQRRCTQCTDARKDQLILGMTIINSMKKSKDGWDGGSILDPENGKVYRCKMHVGNDGKKLVVRGYLGISLFGRSQTWDRVQ